MDALEDNDDVQDVYANFDIPEGVLEPSRPDRKACPQAEGLRCRIPASMQIEVSDTAFVQSLRAYLQSRAVPREPSRAQTSSRSRASGHALLDEARPG